jgi:undecaprenyl-diphosphatase
MALRPHYPLLVSLLVVAAIVTILVASGNGTILAVDQRVALLLRDPHQQDLPRGPRWLLPAFLVVTQLGSIPTLGVVVIVAGAGLLHQGWRRSALLGVYLGAVGLNWGIKALVGRPRPATLPALIELPTSPSFPSGHALISASVYLLIARMGPPAPQGRTVVRLALAGSIVVLIGVSRLYLGVHYTSDVIGGWCLGTAWMLVGTTVVQRILRTASRPV